MCRQLFMHQSRAVWLSGGLEAFSCRMPQHRSRPSSLVDGGQRAELLNDRVKVRDTPVLGDLAVNDPHGVDRLKMNFPAGGRDAEEVAPMGAMIDFVGGDEIAIGALPVDLRAEVGKGGTQPAVELVGASFVRSAA